MLRHELMRLFSEPMAIEERALKVIEAYALRTILGDDGMCARTIVGAGIRGPEAAAGDASQGQDGYDLVGSTAVVHIWGVLDRKDPQSKGKRIGTGYERITRTMAAAGSDQRVGSILLHIDSPGGAVRGITEAADAIAAAAKAGKTGGKPVFGFAPDLMASAALYLGTQVERLYGGPGAWVGSLGVRLAVWDYSTALDREGVKLNVIKTGEFKDLGNPYRAMTERDRAKLQDEVNAYFGHFKNAVARGRGLSAEQVNAIATGEGFIGEQAVKVGLLDGIRGSLGELAAELSRKYPAPSAGRSGARMSADRGIAMDPKELADKAGGTNGQAAKGETTKGDAGRGETGRDAGVGEKKAEVAGTIGNVTAAETVGTAAATAASTALQNNMLRTAAIISVCAPFLHVEGVQKLQNEATLDLGMTKERVEAKLLNLVTDAAKPVGSIDISIGSTGWEREKNGMEAVLCARMAPNLVETMKRGDAKAKDMAVQMGLESPEAFVKTYTQAEAGGLRRMKLMDVAERCASQALGVSGGGGRGRFKNDDHVLATAFGHSSSDFPNLLAVSSQKILMKYFAETPSTWERWCGTGDARDFKPQDLITLSELPNLKLLPEGKAPDEASFNERKESISLLTYGRKTSVTRQTMINDDLGGFTRQWQLWGITAKRTPEILAYGILTANPTMADGTVMFHANHGNLLSGSGAGVLSRANLIAASKKMMLQKGFGKDKAPLMIDPKYLIVPIALWDTAWECVRSVFDPTRNNTNSNVPNSVQALGLEDPIKSPYLDAVSAAQWYLLGDKDLAPTVQLNFLNGNRNPIITQVGNGSIRGIEFEVLFDVGASKVNWESAATGDGT